jgi:hypothetical protein
VTKKIQADILPACVSSIVVTTLFNNIKMYGLVVLGRSDVHEIGACGQVL